MIVSVIPALSRDPPFLQTTRKGGRVPDQVWHDEEGVNE